MKNQSERREEEPILTVNGLKVYFPISSGKLFVPPMPLKAVDDVSFELYSGETLGVVGESGCGKSTLGRGILQLIEPTAGEVIWEGKHLEGLPSKEMIIYRKNLQIIFQDPLASLNPRMTIGDIIAEPLTVHYPQLSNEQKKEKVAEIMEQVGLLPQMINRYPHEFSGGQCQRIGVARAMILRPKLIVCDEPVSALDVSIQAQIVNLIQELQQSFGLSLIFISHDLSIVRHISHRIMVLYLGNVMEVADKQTLYDEPKHPYTKALISAVPIPDPELEKNKQRIVLEGDLPSPLTPPSGCVFRTRCPIAKAICAKEKPHLVEAGKNHQVACHFWDK
ncbi:ABC transporter ATP-binding protein [Desulfosediminicola flagellatus]|uniref:ABC transporter ATP-binding protein n=1 Tax=Desulfosediminicola flagellatus TaxID=2569541 RepID=UPI0010AC3C9B|nr:dipeptide ABC transporter ATP-binding protein [Desulfosediminicola flagellatus]